MYVCVCVCVCVLFVCTAAIPSCPEQTLGLVHYPTTLAPTGTSKTVYVSCADNAHVRSGYSLRVLCTTDGTWEYTRRPECDCDRGYRINTANERHKCEGERPRDHFVLFSRNIHTFSLQLFDVVLLRVWV